MISRLVCLVFGYFCGTIQTGYFLGKARGIDIRDYGSHNTGATNSLRVMGTAAGILVLLGDAFKAIIPCLLVRHFYADRPEITLLMVLWTGLGVMLGHDYPFYLGFQGGKGVASTVGIMLSLSPALAGLWIAIFVIVVAVSRFISLGSILSMVFLGGCLAAGAMKGFLPVGEAYRLEFMAVGLIIPVLSIWRHRANIGRLLRGEENRFTLFTKGMDTSKEKK